MSTVPPPLTPGLDEPCPHCGQEVGAHTIRGWGDCLHAQGFNYNQPYAEIPGGPLRMEPLADDQIMVGSLDVGAGTVDTALGTLPILVFRFYAAGLDPGSKVPTPQYVLVGDVPMMQRTKELVNKNVNAAIRAAR